MNFIESIKERAKKNVKTIVLPETMDERVLKAAEVVLEDGIANIILIGKENDIDLDIYKFSRATIIDPETSPLTNEFIDTLYELRKEKGLTKEEARDLLLNDYMYYACMLVKTNRADGVVSGACHSTSNTLRPALQIIKTAPGVSLVSAFFLMIVPDCEYGENGVFIFADSDHSLEQRKALGALIEEIPECIVCMCISDDECQQSGEPGSEMYGYCAAVRQEYW